MKIKRNTCEQTKFMNLIVEKVVFYIHVRLIYLDGVSTVNSVQL
jgi:hypothetical protein